MKTCVACEAQIIGDSVLSLISASTMRTSGVSAALPEASGLLKGRPRGRRVRRVNKANKVRELAEDLQLEAMVRQATSKSTDSANQFSQSGNVADRITTAEGMIREIKNFLPEDTLVKVKTHLKSGKKFVIYRKPKETEKIMLFEDVAMFLCVNEYLRSQTFPTSAKNEAFKNFWNSLNRQHVSATELSKHSALRNVIESCLELYKTAFGEDFTFKVEDKKLILTTSALTYPEDESSESPLAQGQATIELAHDSLSAPLKFFAELKTEEREALGLNKEFLAHFPGAKVPASRRQQRNSLSTKTETNVLNLASDARSFLSTAESDKLDQKIDALYEDPKRQLIRAQVLAYHKALVDYLEVQKNLGLPTQLIPESQNFLGSAAGSPFAADVFGNSQVATPSRPRLPFFQNTTATKTTQNVWDAALRMYALTNRDEFTESANSVRGTAQRLLSAMGAASLLREFHDHKLGSLSDMEAKAAQSTSTVADAAVSHPIERNEVTQLYENLKKAMTNLMDNDFLLHVVYETMDRN